MKSTNMWKYFILLIIAIFLSYSSYAQMDYYWIGGSGNWSDYSNHWSTSSGGNAFHTSTPNDVDNVIFDENSFTEDNQVVILDLEDAEIHGMDWRGLTHSVSFVSDNTMDYTELAMRGSVYLSAQLTMGVKNLSFYPSKENDVFFTENVSFENARLYFFCQNGGLEVYGNVLSRDISFVNMFYDIDFNSNEIRTTNSFELRLALYATVDLTMFNYLRRTSELLQH